VVQHVIPSYGLPKLSRVSGNNIVWRVKLLKIQVF